MNKIVEMYKLKNLSVKLGLVSFFFFISVDGFRRWIFSTRITGPLEKIQRKSTYFRFLKIHQDKSSNSKNFISSIFSFWWIFGGLLSHFREHGK